MKTAVGLLLLLCIVVGTGWFVNSRINREFPESSSWQFAVISDVEGLSPISEAMIEDMKLRDIEFVVNLGDLAGAPDKVEIQRVLDAFTTLPVPTYTVPGNNDLIYNEEQEVKTLELYTQVVNEATYYSFDLNNAHMVLLDNSYRRYGFTDEELEWLEQDLSTNTQSQTFVFYHRPLDVPGQQLFGDDETPNSRIQNEKFKQLISPFTIDRIFNGHLHTTLNYTLQSVPVTITGGGGATPQEILGGADAAYFHYLIVTVHDNAPHTVDVVSFETEPTSLPD